MKKFRSIFSSIAIMTLVSGITNAQVMLQKATISSGGSMASNSTMNAGVTAGQPITGTASNSQMKAEIGFWTSENAVSGVLQIANMQLGIEVWPNPVSSIATASITLANASNLDVQLFDINGKEVKSIFSGYISSGIRSMEIDLSGLASGTYILAARIPGQIVESRISVIQ
jgi:Secretion system C-terminal sorting domain